MLEATWGNVILKLDNPDEEIKGIYLPDRAKEQKMTGVVISVGPGVVDNTGKFKTVDVKVGDRVVWGRHLGYKIPHNGEKYYHLQGKFIEAVFGTHEHDLPWYTETKTDPRVHYEYLYVDLDHADPKLEAYTKQGWGVFSTYRKAGMPQVLRLFRPIQARYETTVSAPDLSKIGLTHVIEIEYRDCNLKAYHAEPKSPEWKQLELMKAEGWEPDVFIEDLHGIYVTRFKRIKS